MADGGGFARLATWLPKGTSQVAAGIMVNGLATYLFLLIPARSGRLDPSTYAVFSALWFAAYLIGPGLYVPLEQELSRLTARARAAGRPGDRAALAALKVVAVSSGVVAIGLVLGRRAVGGWFFDDRAIVALILAASIVSSGMVQWTKGWLGGSHQFGRYAVLVGAEGVVRAVAVAVLALSGVTSPAAYAVPVVASPLLASFLVLAGSRPELTVGRPQPARPVATAIATLSVAQLGAQLLMNGVPLSLALFAGPDQTEVVGRLGAALVLARVPLFLFQAVQAVLLPGLATMVEHGDLAGFGRRVRVVTIGLAGLGALAVVGGAGLGPLATRILFGAAFEATSVEFGALSLSAIIIVLALVAGQALIALDADRLVAFGWSMGALAFVVVGVIGDDLERRSLTAGIVGPLVAVAVLGFGYFERLSDRSVAQALEIGVDTA